jgi:hypothetical protein
MCNISNHSNKCHEKWVIDPTKNLFLKIKTLSFHLAASMHVISAAVGNPHEMTWEVNMFILAVNSKLIISHWG